MLSYVFLKELPLNMQFDQGYFLSMYDAVCLQFLFTVISDVAKTLFTQYISRSKNEESLTYNFFFLEEYYETMPPRPATTTQADAEAANTTQTQTSTTQSNVTSGGSNVTTSFIENEGEVPAIAPATANCTPAIPTATTTKDKTPWWLKHEDNRDYENQDDPPSQINGMCVCVCVCVLFWKLRCM